MEFDTHPVQSVLPKQTPFSEREKQLIDEEITKLQTTLAEYILHTEKLRSSSKLFFSFIRPHKPVTTSSIGKWIKSVLSSAGIDTLVFKAHSVRGAAVTNVYIKGVPVAEMLCTADWTNERTFRKYQS